MSTSADPSCRCHACGIALRPNALFCDQCGNPTASPGFAEHKQVTVLFADVVGSMRLAAHLDPERLRSVMIELFNRAAAVVQQYQGTVDKFTGDGLMALFGAPTALEDHALRACVAALEIQAVAAELGRSVFAADGVELHVRVGLNSGDVIAGDVGSGPGRYTAVGHPVGLAQRMESGAPPGGVLCSLTTADLVAGTAMLGPIQMIDVKGFDAPVPGRQLLAVDSDRAVVGRDEGTLLGRDAELGLLTSLLRSGKYPVIGITGSPGVGKSRLVREMQSLMTDADVVVARCDAHTSGIAFRALSRLLRALFDVQGLEPAEARSSTADQLGWRNCDSAEAQTLFEAMGIAEAASPQLQLSVGGRRRMLVATIAAALRQRPRRTILVIEDVHWIDTPSDDVLTLLTAEFGREPGTVLIATHRPGFEGALRKRFVRQIVLAPLSPEATRDLAEHILGPAESVRDLCEQVAEAGGGNPYFVEEIVRDLAGRGVLEGGLGRYRLVGDAYAIAVPPTVNAVLAARIDRLPAEAKAMLNAAAVIGSQFDLETLRLLASSRVDEHMAGLVAAELIDQTEFVPEQRFSFHHPLVRAVAYESQLTATRSATHTKLARIIQSRPGFTDMDAGLVATHLEAAGELADSHHWHMRAAQWLRYRDLPAARSHWKSARDVADRMGGETPQILEMRIAPRAMLTSTTLYVGDDSDSDRVYDELRELAARSGDLESLALGMAGRMFTFTVNDNRTPEAVELAAELHTIRGRIECDSAVDSILLNSLAFTHVVAGQFDAAAAVLDSLAGLTDVPPIELVPAVALRGFMEMCRGRTREGRQHLTEAMREGPRLHPVARTSILIYPTILQSLGIDPQPDLVSDVTSAAERSEASGDQYSITLGRWLYGTVILRRQPDSAPAALESLRQARSEILEHRICRAGLSTIVTDLALQQALGGQVDTAIERLRDCFETVVVGLPAFASVPAEALVDLLVERGTPEDIDEAATVLQHWPMGVPAFDMWCPKARASIAFARGDEAAGTREAEQYLDTCIALGATNRIPQARVLARLSGPRSRTA